MAWQPMPPPATAPSGTIVDRLCGQPEQKYGVRLTGSSASRVGSRRAGASAISGWAASTRRSGSANAPAVSSPATGTSGRPCASADPNTAGASARP